MGVDSRDKIVAAWIIVLSGFILAIVVFLLFMPDKVGVDTFYWVGWLPHLHGVINACTTVFLITGFYFIRKNNIQAHRAVMTSCFVLGSLFLVSYVTYHGLADSTKFGDTNGDGTLSNQELEAVNLERTIYFIILASHILLAAIVIPFVLLAFYYAWSKQFERHKKIVKYTLPIWLYVSITGVIVYLMIRPFYS